MSKLLGLLTGAMGGIWGYVAAFVFGSALAVGATYTVVHNANAVEIGSLKLAAKTKEAADITASLTQLQGFIAGIHIAQTNYQTTLETIAANTRTAANGWKNATAKPLPLDCVPPVDRLRNVNAAIRATNSATAATP